MNERQGVSGQVFEVLCQPAATSKPSEGAFDHPPSRDDFEACRLIGTFHDLGHKIWQSLLLGCAEFGALIASVGEEPAQKWIKPKQGRQHQAAPIAILNVGGMDHSVQQQAYRIDEDMALLALDLFPRIVAVRVNAAPPFSALFTL